MAIDFHTHFMIMVVYPAPPPRKRIDKQDKGDPMTSHFKQKRQIITKITLKRTAVQTVFIFLMQLTRVTYI